MADSETPAVISADPNETGVYEIESLCMNCRDEVRESKLKPSQRF